MSLSQAACPCLFNTSEDAKAVAGVDWAFGSESICLSQGVYTRFLVHSKDT